MLDNDDKKPKWSHCKEAITKCPQRTALVADHCKLILDHFDNNKISEIKEIVIKSDIYIDDYLCYIKDLKYAVCIEGQDNRVKAIKNCSSGKLINDHCRNILSNYRSN